MYDWETVKLNYIAIPILIGFEPLKNLSFVVGPELGYLIKANSKLDGYQRLDRTKDFTRFEVSIDLGVSYRFFKNLSIDVRYSESIKNFEYNYFDLSKHEGGNQVLQAGFAYTF